MTDDSAGTGFFYCAQKEVRVGKNGEFISLLLQDATGRIAAKVFEGVDRLRSEFDAGEFVKVRARANRYNDALQLIVENIRRVNRDQDGAAGFREEACVPSSPRPAGEMWAELEALLGRVKDPSIGALLARVVARFESRLRIWPAAQTIHHAYRGGFLEHILKIAEVVTALARAYGANEDLAVAGAILHDIGKLEELDYDVAASYSSQGRLVGHIMLGVVIVRDEARQIEGFPQALQNQIEHLIVSHHGSREFGSPIEPMMVEAFILAMADNLDATINQVRQAVEDDTGDSEFTTYHKRLGRVLWKG
jgi:3'-5' exoribonuclease